MYNSYNTKKELLETNSDGGNCIPQIEPKNGTDSIHYVRGIVVHSGVPTTVEEMKQQARRQRQAQSQDTRYQFTPIQEMPPIITISTEPGNSVQSINIDVISNEEEFVRQTERAMNNHFYFQYLRRKLKPIKDKTKMVPKRNQSPKGPNKKKNRKYLRNRYRKKNNNVKRKINY